MAKRVAQTAPGAPPPSNGVAPGRDESEAEPTLPLDTPEAPEEPAAPKAGHVRLTTQIKGDEVIELVDDEPSAAAAPAKEEPAAPAGGSPPAAPASPAKPDKFKPWRMADGKLDEDKFAADVEPLTIAGAQINDLIEKDPEVRKTVWAAQKKRGFKLTDEQEAELATLSAPPAAPPPKVMTREEMHAQYLSLWKQGKGVEAEELMTDWKLDQKFGSKIAEADRIAQETKAQREVEAKQRAESESDRALKSEFVAAASKYDGVLAVEGDEVVWTDRAVMDAFNERANKFKGASVEDLLEWSLAKLGRLQVEPEPSGRPTPRIASKAPALPAKKKATPGMVTLRVSTPQLRVEDEE